MCFATKEHNFNMVGDCLIKSHTSIFALYSSLVGFFVLSPSAVVYLALLLF